MPTTPARSGEGRRVIPLAVQANIAPPDRASLRWLAVAPHRYFFFLGMLGLAAASLWWLVQLWARALGVPIATALPPSWMHGWMMANAFMPFFMFGFLFTAGPKWLNVVAAETRTLMRPGALAFAGLALALAGAHIDTAIVAAGALAMAAGWAALLVRFFRLVRASRLADQVHARLVLAFFSLGALAHAAFAWGATQMSAAWVHTAEMLSIWLFIAPVYVTVAHRLIPFFTASVVPFLDAWRPLWLLAAFVSIVVGHGLLPVAAVLLPSQPTQALRLAVDVVGAALLFFVAWRWGVVQSLRNRLLAMLHLGFFWLGIAFALYAWNQAVVLLDAPAASIGLAPLHALTMGFFGTVLLAMVTRVTAGHGGRTLAADRLTWVLFWLLQVAVLARVAADAAPAHGVWLTPAAIAL
ncbi:MAG: NnrS family protein, partial [Burkholderiaceae bacterium]|nr:NnrS family protein [Burkholderiaceae bacterium]